MTAEKVRERSVLDFIYKRLDAWLEKGQSRWKHYTQEDNIIKELHLELTYRCDSKCIMCNLWSEWERRKGQTGKELTIDEIKAFVENSNELGSLEIIVLSGGEPLLREDIAELVDFFSKRYPKASIGILSNLVNGELVKKQLQEIFKRGKPNLWIGSSLDGIGKTHDVVRGRPGAFDGLMNTIAMIRKEFPGIDISFTFILTPVNYKDLIPAFKLANKLRIGFGCQYVVQKEETRVFRWKEKEHKEIDEQIDSIMNFISNSKNAMKYILENKEGEAKWLWSQLTYWKILKLYGRKNHRYLKPCLSGRRYAMIDPWGDLYFCSILKKNVLGNIRKEGFDILWGSTKAQKLRKQIESGKCNCWLMCSANPVIDKILKLAIDEK